MRIHERAQNVVETSAIVCFGVCLAHTPRAAVQVSARDGALREWVEDYGQQEAHHRHISHLYGLYPGSTLACALDPTTLPAPPTSVSADESPSIHDDSGGHDTASFRISEAERLRNALHITLEQRGDGGKGFSRAWKAACWARLRYGDRALRIVTRYLRKSSASTNPGMRH